MRGVGAVIGCVLAGWAVAAGPMVEALQPDVTLTMDAVGSVRMRCGVTPVGPAGYTGPAELHGSLGPEVGSWRIVATFAVSLSLDASDARTFVDWRIRLPAGTYTLTWGEPCEGETEVTFSVAADEAGRLVLIAPERSISPLTPYTIAVADQPSWQADPDARRAVAWARAALAMDLAVCARKIEVIAVLAREFPDASLGVRVPGTSYAQAITPGYVIRLANEDREFECRVAGERLVRVPDLPAGRIPDEVWAIQVFAYHPAVDLLLHGYLACSADAVLPLTRWVPLDASPLVAALTLLLGEGLAPWEGEAGYTSEFPLPGVSLAEVYAEDGVLTVALADPEHRTSGGACRTGILRAQIEKTALQFPGVAEVRILPPEALQP